MGSDASKANSRNYVIDLLESLGVVESGQLNSNTNLCTNDLTKKYVVCDTKELMSVTIDVSSGKNKKFLTKFKGGNEKVDIQSLIINDKAGAITDTLDQLLGPEFPYLKEIQIYSSTGLTGSLVAGKDKASLKTVIITGSLSGPIPDRYKGVKYLYLERNSLSEFTSDAFTALQEVNLASNRLTTASAVWSSAETLKYVDLSSNEIKDAIPNVNTPKLTVLNISRNRYTGSIPQSIINSKLQALDASQNGFSGSIPDLAPTTELLYLNVSHNTGLSGMFYLYADVLTPLMDLDVSNTSVEVHVHEKWFFKSSIQIFSAAGTTVEFIEPTVKAAFPPLASNTLVSLDLRNARLSGPLPLLDMSKLPKLTSLYLTGNQITDCLEESWSEHPVLRKALEDLKASGLCKQDTTSSTSSTTTPTTSSTVTPANPTPTKAPGSPDATDSKDGLSAGAIAGIVIGVVVGLALLAVVIVLLVRCCRKRKQAAAGAKDEDDSDKSEDHTYGWRSSAYSTEDDSSWSSSSSSSSDDSQGSSVSQSVTPLPFMRRAESGLLQQRQSTAPPMSPEEYYYRRRGVEQIFSFIPYVEAEYEDD